jgi:hypothetical protein
MKMCGHKTRAVFDRYNVTSERDIRHVAMLLGRRPGIRLVKQND